MKITFLTVAPEVFSGFMASHVAERAAGLGVLQTEVFDLRSIVQGSFRAIDDSPFGGGRGLVLRAKPILDALGIVDPEHKALRIVMTPAGRPFKQADAKRYAELADLVILCGHYEGIDERALSAFDERVCIGDYVLTGGELAGQVVADAAVRLLPGVLKQGSAEEESFEDSLLEYPQYTQPADLDGDRVPEVLLSGDHARIRQWRRQQALELTERLRPDLYAEHLERSGKCP